MKGERRRRNDRGKRMSFGTNERNKFSGKNERRTKIRNKGRKEGRQEGEVMKIMEEEEQR